MELKVTEIECKSAIGKCGFPGGGWAINPYIGCGHNCVYCYARFIKRFTGHTEKWGAFVDVRMNIADVLKKQLKSTRYENSDIYIGTVTDPYQAGEEKYQLTRKILELLINQKSRIHILTKSDLVTRDIEILKKLKDVDVDFTINTFDEKWKNLIEPDSPSINKRLEAIMELGKNNIKTEVMVGPYWPEFTKAEELFPVFKQIGVKKIYSESLNTIGGNWSGIEQVLKKNYPDLLNIFKEIYFKPCKLEMFNKNERQRLETLANKYKIQTVVYFGSGHAAKFKN